jgi:hypothetical protein
MISSSMAFFIWPSFYCLQLIINLYGIGVMVVSSLHLPLKSEVVVSLFKLHSMTFLKIFMACYWILLLQFSMQCPNIFIGCEEIFSNLMFLVLLSNRHIWWKSLFSLLSIISYCYAMLHVSRTLTCYICPLTIFWTYIDHACTFKLQFMNLYMSSVGIHEQKNIGYLKAYQRKHDQPSAT